MLRGTYDKFPELLLNYTYFQIHAMLRHILSCVMFVILLCGEIRVEWSWGIFGHTFFMLCRGFLYLGLCAKGYCGRDTKDGYTCKTIPKKLILLCTCMNDIILCPTVCSPSKFLNKLNKTSFKVSNLNK